MTYHDNIITITLCRGELAVSLGEQGLMVTDWKRFTAALNRELSRETANRKDGHTGSSAVGDLLIQRVIERYDPKANGIAESPDDGPKECWPFGERWFEQ